MKMDRFERSFGSPKGKFQAMIKAGRPYQWAKNVLLFVPLLLDNQHWSVALFVLALLAFLCFALMASGVYIINDLLDLQADRIHPTKHNRPFASGALPIPIGMVLAPGLFTVSIALASWLLPYQFLLTLLLYAGSTFAYSLYLKQRLILVVLCLACLYTRRIFAGGCLPDLVVSKWLLEFSIFFFLSMAFVKRFREILLLQDNPTPADKPSLKLGGRNYYVGDLDPVRTLGLVTGVVAVLVFSLYISDETVRKGYRYPDLLWLLTPVLLYWICRVWFLAERRQLSDDPVVFALRDSHSYLAGVITVLVLLFAK